MFMDFTVDPQFPAFAMEYFCTEKCNILVQGCDPESSCSCWVYSVMLLSVLLQHGPARAFSKFVPSYEPTYCRYCCLCA